MSVTIRAEGRDLRFPHSARTSISSLIDQCLQKIGPAAASLQKGEHWRLEYNRKILSNDASLSAARVPPGAMLTLVRKKMKAKPTKVALQPPKGQRMTAEFPMDTSLLAILVYFEPQLGVNIVSKPDQPYSYPVITFMNRRFSTVEELRTTSLLSLGAVNSLLRLSFNPPSGKTPLDLGLDASEFLEEADTPTETDPTPDKKKVKLDSDSPSSTVTSILESPSPSPAEKPKGKPTPVLPSSLERQTQFIQASESKSSVSSEHISDEIFELRASDLRDNGPTLAKLAPFERPKFLEDQKKRFHTVKIRVVFPTQDILQAQFAVTETISDVVSFVRSCLSDSETPFELFVIPPKRVLPLKATLFDEGLYPAAKIFLAWKSSPPEGCLLRSDLELYTPPPKPEAAVEETSPTKVPEEVASASTTPPKKTQSKPRGDAPKWFMMGKK